MAINIDINTPATTPAAAQEEEVKKPQDSIKLNARKSLDGNIMIFDHEDMDIVVMPSKKKVVTFPKDLMEDKVYASQDRLFYFLRKKGIVDPETVHAGSVYGSIEGIIVEPIDEGVNNVQAAVRSIGKFIEEERPYFNVYDDMEEEYEQRLTEPDDRESTELGEVPHEAEKGSLRPGYVRGPFGMSTFYRYEE